MNQRERLSPNSPTSKVGKCPSCGIVEFEVNEAGYIICSECKNPYHLTTYHSLTSE